MTTTLTYSEVEQQMFVSEAGAMVDRSEQAEAAATAKLLDGVRADAGYAIHWYADRAVEAQETARLWRHIYEQAVGGATYDEVLDLIRRGAMRQMGQAARSSRSTSAASNLVESCKAEAWARVADFDGTSGSLAGLKWLVKAQARREVAKDEYQALWMADAAVKAAIEKRDRCRSEASKEREQRKVNEAVIARTDAQTAVLTKLALTGWKGTRDDL